MSRLLLVLGIFVFVSAILYFFSKKVQKAKARIQAKLESKTFIFKEESANFFGQKSKGMSQVRGNGVLALSDGNLYFGMFMPEKELLIRCDRITGLRSEKSFLGKSKFTPLLIVSFKNDDGIEDEAAWLVKDLQTCMDQIEQRISH